MYIVSFSKKLTLLQNLWRKWRTRFPVYSTCSTPSRWLAGQPLLSCPPNGARRPLPSSRSSLAAPRLPQHRQLYLAARVQRVAIDLNFCSKESQGQCRGSPASGPPGSALPRRRLWCCSWASSLLSNPPSTTSSCPPLSDLRGSPPNRDGEAEGWLPAYILPTGWGGRRFTSTSLPVNAAGRPCHLGPPSL